MVVMGLTLFIGSQAFADVVGRLQFSVKNADDEKPVSGAKIEIDDPTNVSPPAFLTSDANGSATTGLLLNHAWKIKVTSGEFDTDTRTVTVVADTTTPIEVLLEPLQGEGDHGQRNADRHPPEQPHRFAAAQRAGDAAVPHDAGQQAELQRADPNHPGMVSDSVGQLHPEGEHSSTSIYINGFQLPGAFQGRFGQIVSPVAVENADVMTGAYAPEYGRETAAIINVQLKAGTIDPFFAYNLTGGTYGTAETGLTAGGQFGSAYGAPNDAGKRGSILRLFLQLRCATDQ